MSQVAPEVIAKLASTPRGRRAIAARSPIFFDTFYCGMRYAPHRERWLNLVEQYRAEARENNDKVRLLLLAPRDHGKTEFSITLAARAVCLDRNIRILWISEAGPAAEKRLRRVKALLESEKIRADWTTAPKEGFGPFIRDEFKDKWTEKFIQVNRTVLSVDPTVEAVGSGGGVTGGHFDLILVDDLEDDRTTHTEMERRKTRDWFFGTVGPMLSPGGFQMVVGTHKHYDDLYMHLKKNPAWRVIEDPAIIQWPTKYEYELTQDERGRDIVKGVKIEGPSEVLWPAERPIDYLLREQFANTARIFAREWQHQVQDDASARFRREWLDRAMERGQNLSLYEMPSEPLAAICQGWDLSLVTDKKRAEDFDRDFSVGITLGRAKNGDRYLLGMWRGRGLTPAQLHARIQEEYRRFNGRVHRVVVEKNAFGHLHYQALQENTDLPLRDHTTGKDKIDPFEGVPSLQPLFENGKFVIPSKTQADRDAVAPLIQELWGLGKERHDDAVISLWISERAVRAEGFEYQVAFEDKDFTESSAAENDDPVSARREAQRASVWGALPIFDRPDEFDEDF